MSRGTFFIIIKIPDMKELFVDYKVAQLLQEKGFDEPCFAYFVDKEIIIGPRFAHVLHNTNSIGKKEYKEDWECFAPLYQQVILWLLYKHNILVTVTSISQESWQWHITKPKDPLGLHYGEDFASYEEALEDGIKEALKLI